MRVTFHCFSRRRSQEFLRLLADVRRRATEIITSRRTLEEIGYFRIISTVFYNNGSLRVYLRFAREASGHDRRSVTVFGNIREIPPTNRLCDRLPNLFLKIVKVLSWLFEYFVPRELRRYELLMVSVTHLAISIPYCTP